MEPLVTILNKDSILIYALPEPSAYSSTVSTMVDSGTSVSGKVLGSIVRDDVRKINMSWNYLTNESWAKINKMFKTESATNKFINKVKFFDQTATGTDDKWIESDMYVSDRSAGMWRRDEIGNVIGWTGCSIELTEV